jgi:hypothetical protein
MTMSKEKLWYSSLEEQTKDILQPHIEKAVLSLAKIEDLQEIDTFSKRIANGAQAVFVGGIHLSPYDNVLLTEIIRRINARTLDNINPSNQQREHADKWIIPASYTFFVDNLRNGTTNIWRKRLNELFTRNGIIPVPVIRPLDYKSMLKAGQSKEETRKIRDRVNDSTLAVIQQGISQNVGFAIYPSGGTSCGRRKKDDIQRLNGLKPYPKSPYLELAMNQALAQNHEIQFLVAGFNGTHKVFAPQTEKLSDAATIRMALSLSGMPHDPVPGAHVRLHTFPFSSVSEDCIGPDRQIDIQALNEILHDKTSALIGPEERGVIDVTEPSVSSLSFKDVNYARYRIQDLLQRGLIPRKELELLEEIFT